MPFLVQKVEPRYIGRGHVPSDCGNWPVGAELEAVANGALAASLRQLASVLNTAEDIFAVLTKELTNITDRSSKLKAKIDKVEAKLLTVDPKKITVPESDICSFAARTEHFSQRRQSTSCLFTTDSRPKALRELYNAAAQVAVRSLDSLRRDREESSLDMYLCTPVLAKKKRREQSLDIESRVPRAIEELRRWTSSEALGDVTVAPDCATRILSNDSTDGKPVDHKLPSPEEQLQAMALKFPAEIVAVDVSGRNFRRMSIRRRSMHTSGQDAQETAVKRRSRPRRPRGKRRNTIAGTDQKEIRQAVGGSTTTASVGTSSTSLSHARRMRGRDMSASSSVTSEGTLTPDIIQDITVIPFSDDGENSSVYSCDTEGYYTSFHVDSGLKTLREEESLPQSPLTKSTELQNDPSAPLGESEYELYGRGSTSTTTSSAGTVCTVMAPPPPERKSSLTVVAMVHDQKQNGGESPDSGHNTSSSPVESASSPACTGRSCSEFEYSESSDLEGCERIERIRSKTAINTSRIPSMCVITPPGSDDEHTHSKDTVKSAQIKKEQNCKGSVLMSATVGTSKMEVINGQDKNLYATVQTVVANPSTPVAEQSTNDKVIKTSPLSGVLCKLRGVLPGKKHQQKYNAQDNVHADSGDYVTIADVRNNNNKSDLCGNPKLSNTLQSSTATYANADLFQRDAEYVSLSELPKKDSSLERRRQGARVTLDSAGKVVYSSDSLKRRKGAHTTFIPGPFVKDSTSSPASSPLLRRNQVTPRPVTKTLDNVDGKLDSNQIANRVQQSTQTCKMIIRAAKSPDRAVSPDFVRTPSTVVSPTNNSNSQQKQSRGAYVNVLGNEEKAITDQQPDEQIFAPLLKQEPPPYVNPPQFEKLQNIRSPHEIYDEHLHRMQPIQSNLVQNKQNYLQNINIQHNFQNINPYHGNYYEKNNLIQNRHNLNYSPSEKIFVSQLQNSVEQTNCKNPNQFHTLPNRRAQREVVEPRSITPDITRGLARGPINPMQIMNPQYNTGYLPINHLSTTQMSRNSNLDMHKRNLKDAEVRCGFIQQIQQQKVPTVDVNNRFASSNSPTNVSSYRSYSSPTKTNLTNVPISPIGPEAANGFKSSTPTGRGTPTVAERLALQANRCISPNPAIWASASGRHTPVIGEKGIILPHGRSNTPTHLILSPTKCTMSNEELFAVIHKSKKRLNIKDDTESLSPASSCSSLTNNIVGTRHSWSPESQKVPEVPKTVLSPTSISRMDFKRLLLQQSIKSGPTRISAAEQLRLSRNQSPQEYQPQTPKSNTQPNPLSKVMSPRSVWRFHTPRTDVLSSTIIEDAAAEEKAMKPSPENSLNSKSSPRRQLDLSSDSSEENVRVVSNSEEIKNNSNNSIKSVKLDKSEKEIENRVVQNVKNNNDTPNIVKSILLNKQNPLKAIENRRISNQLARAQFLAGNNNISPPSQNSQNRDIFSKRFRARSESPQQKSQKISQNNVNRSPSAPTLETAL